MSATNPVVARRAARTIADLAAAADLPEVTIARIESGISRRPHAATLAKLAAALDVPTEQLERELLDWHHGQVPA